MIELLPRHAEWTAIVTGRVTADNKPFAAALEADIKAAGLSERIRILGEVDDIKPWYRRLTLYVAPPATRASASPRLRPWPPRPPWLPATPAPMRV